MSGAYIKMRLSLAIFMVTAVMLPFQNCSSKFQTTEGIENSNSNGTPTNDKTPPAVTVLSPMTGLTVKNQLSVSGVCEAGSSNVLLTLSGTAFSQSAPCNSGNFTTAFSLTVADGDYTVLVSQTDPAGNKGTASFDFHKDTTAPAITVASPAANASVTNPSLTVSGACESGLNVSVSGTAILAAVTVPCTNAMYSASTTVGGASRTDSFVVTQTDLAGNSASVTRSIQIALAAGAPSIKITAPAANSVSKAGITVTGTCVTGLTVTVAGQGAAQSTQVACTNAAFSSAVAFTSGDGSKTISVSQTNAQGQVGQDARTFIVDSTAPAIAILSPAAGTKNLTGVTVAGSCETGLTVSLTGDLSASVNTPCNNATFSAAVTFSTGAGMKTVTAKQTDAVGNVGTNARGFERIDPAPLDGAVLYANNCAGCHNPLATSTKIGRTSSTIKSAIASYAQMKSLSVLTDPEVDAIAAALVNPTTPTTPSTTIPTPSLPSGTVRIPMNANNLNRNNAFGSIQMRRLTKTEIYNTLNVVLGVNPGTTIDKLPKDEIDEKLNVFDNDVSLQDASPIVVQSYDRFAESYAALFLNQGAKIRSLAGCTPSTVDDATCFGKFATNVGLLMLRRPITAAEITRYSNALLPHAKTASDFNVAASLLIQFFVQNPEFLHRIEVGTTVAGTAVKQLNDYEIATRISFLVAGHGPDKTLLDAAASGVLKNTADRGTQATRLLGTAAARAHWERYHALWLGYDEAVMPTGYEADMTGETNKLIDEIVFDANLAWMQIYQYNQTWLTPKLATYYGVTPPSTANWVSYSGKRGGGIFAHGRFLLQGSKFGDTSPTLRGYRILKRVLCQQLGPLPLGVDANSPPPGPVGSCKPAIYSMRTTTACQSCHALTDNIGFGLENFSPAGQWRTTEPGRPTCTISGEGAVGPDKFNGPAEMGTVVAQNPTARECAVRQLFKFTVGRTELSSDQDTIEAMHYQLTQTPTLKSMILSLVQGPAMIAKP